MACLNPLLTVNNTHVETRKNNVRHPLQSDGSLQGGIENVATHGFPQKATPFRSPHASPLQPSSQYLQHLLKLDSSVKWDFIQHPQLVFKKPLSARGIKDPQSLHAERKAKCSTKLYLNQFVLQKGASHCGSICSDHRISIIRCRKAQSLCPKQSWNDFHNSTLHQDSSKVGRGQKPHQRIKKLDQL